MRNIDKLFGSDLFKSALSGVQKAGNTSFEDYMHEIECIRASYVLPEIDEEYMIALYNDALLSYRMGVISFSEMNYIYKSLSSFLEGLEE